MSARWHFAAQFETSEQAKHAAEYLRGLQPVFLHIAYTADATGKGPIRPYGWEEYTRNYPPKEARV